jgi:hypothetical protein
MGNISHYTSLTNGVPSGTSYLTSNDNYLHVYNIGPQALIANYTDASSPAAPSAGTGGGIPVPVGRWTLLPADLSGGSLRIAFAPVSLSDGFGGPDWDGMWIWTV